MIFGRQNWHTSNSIHLCICCLRIFIPLLSAFNQVRNCTILNLCRARES